MAAQTQAPNGLWTLWPNDEQVWGQRFKADLDVTVSTFYCMIIVNDTT